MYDRDGEYPTGIAAGGSRTAWGDAKVTFGKIKGDIRNYDKNNTSEQKVIKANYVSAYKNTVVIKIPGRSGVSFGVIGIGNEVTDTKLVKHEYGHRLQLDDMGVIKYTGNVAIPSVTANLLDRVGKLPYDYYGSPWEAGADKLGGVCRTSNNTPWPEEAYDSYGDLIKLFFE